MLRTGFRLITAAALAALGLATTVPTALAAEGPWLAGEALGLPEWLEISGEQRTRYETLDGQFRANGEGGDQVIAFRTLLRAEARRGRWRVGAEFMDARLALWDDGTPLDTTQVDALEPLQAYVGWTHEDWLVAGSTTELVLGRQTLDLGSRRLVARNAFRNTINAFSGGRLRWEGARGVEVHAFWFQPIVRLPDTRQGLEDAEAVLDDISLRQRFWGLHARSRPLGEAGRLEGYYLRLAEADDDDIQTRNRRLHTLGARLLRAPGEGAFDYDLEGVRQWGSIRASAASTDTRELRQRGDFLHLELGYTWAASWRPRLALLYDYASGDNDPFDGRDARFEPLFGARRFEHGPTGIWGAFARTNIQSPGYRLQLRLPRDLSFSATHRLYWLAESRDAWFPARVADRTGAAGRFVGHQLEASARWEALPGNLSLEAGAAWLAEGRFLERAPNASGQGDALYVYSQATFRF